jgi:arylformamidase
MIPNTGTYMDAPFHFFSSVADTAGSPLDRLVDLRTVVIDARTDIRVGADRMRGLPDVAGAAVLVRTDWSRHWGTTRYAARSPHI